MVSAEEMTPDKAVRYACRALTEEREKVAEELGYCEVQLSFAGNDTDSRSRWEQQVEQERVRIENIDAVRRVLRGMVEGIDAVHP